MLGSPGDGGGRTTTSVKYFRPREAGVAFEEVGKQTTWRWRSFSVLWLYQGSSRSGDHCQAYLRTVLITALLIRMHRYTMRKPFIDLRGQRDNIPSPHSEKRLWRMSEHWPRSQVHLLFKQHGWRTYTDTCIYHQQNYAAHCSWCMIHCKIF